MRVTSSFARLWPRLAVVVFAATLVLPVAFAGMNAGRGAETVAKVTPARPQPTYSVKAGLHGDIFPFLANYASFQTPEERTAGTVSVTITNSSDSVLSHRVTVEIPGWSDQEIQIAELKPGEVRTLHFAPTFLSRLYDNHEITAATARINITDPGGHTRFATTVPVRLRAADDMYWGVRFQYAAFIASWVTPHDPRVEAVLSRAKEFMPRRRLPGYEGKGNSAQQAAVTRQQVSAIFRALQAKGISYVKSSMTLGAAANGSVSERVRLPRESLRQDAANCIDGVVMYASLFENLGMDPVVVLVPGHAYVGVRLAPDSNDYLFLETALTGRASFATAVAAAQRGLARYPRAQITRVAIRGARQAGIFPMPTPQQEASAKSHQK